MLLLQSQDYVTRKETKGWSGFYVSSLGKGSNNQNGNLRWYLPIGVQPPLPPPEWHKFPDIFLPHSRSFAIESYLYETDFTLQKYHF